MPKPVTSLRLLSSSRMHCAQLYVTYFYMAASPGSSFILSSPQTSVMHHPSAPGWLYVTHSRKFQLCWNLKGPLLFEQFFVGQIFALYTTAFLLANNTLTQDWDFQTDVSLWFPLLPWYLACISAVLMSYVSHTECLIHSPNTFFSSRYSLPDPGVFFLVSGIKPRAWSMLGKHLPLISVLLALTFFNAKKTNEASVITKFTVSLGKAKTKQIGHKQVSHQEKLPCT